MTVTDLRVRRRDGSKSFDVRGIVSELEWTTSIDYTAGELKFVLQEQADGFAPFVGDVVAFSWNNHKIFYGYIFAYELKADKTWSITAYDKMRYLASEDDIVWSRGTLANRFDTVAKRAGIKHKGTSTKHILKPRYDDGKTYFTMLQTAINQTRSATGTRYYLRANYDVLELKNMADTRLRLIIGDDSLLTDFSYSNSINNAYNSIKLVRKDAHKKKHKTITVDAKGKKHKKTKTTTTYTYHTETVHGSATIKKWGKMQKVEKADDKLNDAQMVTKAKQLLKHYNRADRSLSLSAIGQWQMRAGMRFYIAVSLLKTAGIGTREVLATKVVHKFGTDWTMEIDVEV